MSFRDHLTVKNIIFIIILLLLLKGISEIMTIALLFFTAFVLAAAFNPIVDKMSKKMKRQSAAAIVLLVAILFTFAFLIPVIYMAVTQIAGFASGIPQRLTQLSEFRINHPLLQNPIFAGLNTSGLIAIMQNKIGNILSSSINITINIFQGFVYFFLACLLTFYFMSDASNIRKGVVLMFPKDTKKTAGDVYDKIVTNVGGYVIAQGINLVAVGIFTGFFMMLIGVDYSAFLGLTTGVLDIIPIVGPTIAFTLCVVTAYNLGLVKIILVILSFLFVQWASNNLLKPVIFGKFLDLHPLIVIFALLVAAKFLGVWGVILSPAIASLVCVLFEEIYIKNINK